MGDRDKMGKRNRWAADWELTGRCCCRVDNGWTEAQTLGFNIYLLIEFAVVCLNLKKYMSCVNLLLASFSFEGRFLTVFEPIFFLFSFV